jgi:hypothetical protein
LVGLLVTRVVLAASAATLTGRSETVATDTADPRNESWTQVQSDRYNMWYAPGNISPEGPVEQPWETAFEGGLDAPPVLANDTLYVATNRQVYAVTQGAADVVWNWTLYPDGRYAVVSTTTSVTVSEEPTDPTTCVLRIVVSTSL